MANSGGSSGPMMARWVEVSRSDIDRLWPDQSSGAIYRSGFQGQPTSKHLIEAELHRRGESGEISQTLAAEFEYLVGWLKQTYPAAPTPTAKTVKNNIRDLYKKLRHGLK